MDELLEDIKKYHLSTLTDSGLTPRTMNSFINVYYSSRSLHWSVLCLLCDKRNNNPLSFVAYVIPIDKIPIHDNMYLLLTFQRRRIVDNEIKLSYIKVKWDKDSDKPSSLVYIDEESNETTVETDIEID